LYLRRLATDIPEGHKQNLSFQGHPLPLKKNIMPRTILKKESSKKNKPGKKADAEKKTKTGSHPKGGEEDDDDDDEESSAAATPAPRPKAKAKAKSAAAKVARKKK
jgi:hypothetical protein